MTKQTTERIQAAQKRHPDMQTYRVQRGDTLWRLAQRFGTSTNALMKLNDIESPEYLLAGVNIVVPNTHRSRQRHDNSPAIRSHTGTSNNTQKASSSPSYSSGARLQWPTKGPLTSRFGPRNGRQHEGIDIGAKQGAKIMAAADGEVIFSGKRGGYGNLVLVKHTDGLVTVYAHNERNLVYPGQWVRRGQLIARVGRTGRATDCHLHFEVRKGLQPVNPLLHLP